MSTHSVPTPPSWARTNDLGQLFDRTIQVYRRNFVLFAAVSAVLAAPDAAILLFGASLATGVLRFISAPFALAAFYLAAAQVVFDGPIGPVAILLRAFRRYPSFAGVLSGYLGAVLALSTGPLGTWLIVAVGGTAACVMAAESLNPWQTLHRRDRLIKGNMARVLLASSAIAIFSIVPMFVLLLSASLLLQLIPTSGSQLLAQTERVVVVLIGALATPIVPIGNCLLYVHLRDRNEGSELDDLAKSPADAA